MRERLIVLDAFERQAAVEFHRDSRGAVIAENEANGKIRGELSDLRRLLAIVLAHPDDPDCAELLDLIRVAATRP